MRSILFLDFDDVLCLNAPYGGRHVLEAARGHVPADLWERLFDQAAKDILLSVMAEFNPHVVLTTSWLRFLDRSSSEALFHRTGLPEVGNALHEVWEAPQMYGQTRLQAIESWLGKNLRGEAFVILDDQESGTGLRGSRHDRAGRVVLCDVGVGLQEAHLNIIRNAL